MIRIYIETNKDTFAKQMAHFVNNCNKSDINIFVVCETQLNEKWLKEQTTTIVINYIKKSAFNNSNLADVLRSVAGKLTSISGNTVELHTSLGASALTVPLFYDLDSLHNISLCLYEDSIYDIMASRKLGKVTDLQLIKVINNYAKEIKSKNKTQSANYTLLYGWHKLYPSKYFLQENSGLKNTKAIPIASCEEIFQEKVSEYFQLYNLPFSMYAALKKIQSGNAVLFLSVYPLSKLTTEFHHEKLKGEIHKAKKKSSFR